MKNCVETAEIQRFACLQKTSNRGIQLAHGKQMQFIDTKQPLERDYGLKQKKGEKWK